MTSEIRIIVVSGGGAGSARGVSTMRMVTGFALPCQVIINVITANSPLSVITSLNKMLFKLCSVLSYSYSVVFDTYV